MSDNASPSLTADVLAIGELRPDPNPVWIDVPGAAAGRVAGYRLAGPPGAGIIPPMKLRRLGRAQAMAVAVVQQAVSSDLASDLAGDDTAVVLGTALGELGETLDFLINMIELEEREPRPARFVNSVHNALAAQIAIHFGCRGENHTFVHRAQAFETALWQGLLLLEAGRARRVVACGVDSITPHALAYGAEEGWYRGGDAPLSPLESGGETGTLPGEGAAALVLAPVDSTSSRLARLSGLSLRPATTRAGTDSVDRAYRFLERSLAGAKGEGASFLLLGANGDAASDALCLELARRLTAAGLIDGYGAYKHQTGEFCTASSLGLTLAVRAVQAGEWPLELAVARPPVAGRVTSICLFHRSPEDHLSAVRVTP